MTLPRRLRAAAITVAASAAALSMPASSQDATPPAGCTGPASDTWINISVDGLRNGDGLLAITLYEDNSRKFLARHGSLYVGRTPADSGAMRTCIFVPKPGIYALALYHDENANRSYDRNGIGYPEEGFGFSNNPPTIAGLPSFRSVRLNIPRTGLSTRVHMKYP